ncbi:ATP-binding protein [Microbacterium pygmaeum]|uniref:Predicted ATPase n=1 Tax=Microbacterium pygmaeum TaxID=370764 RepID=A0A1G8DWG2_9MICO|nr:DUF4062 domain-containing protein [Microbacterium pygmaeum]SDH61921.1 Predicted ATPase [Microbacterium pygmaeum]
MDAHPASIRTPDQRIRVFLSSTLRELEPERDVARAAIESLHLAPVMFELGARPHPPRSLYRSYLAQSDIFVAVYWQSYGWVAPDEEISGLEDEYRLSGGMPHLIYIKEPAPDREARLSALLDRVRSDDTSSYRGFETPAELKELLVADLATLLADRFDASRPQAETTKRPDAAATVPAPYNPLVGRQEEKTRLLELLGAPGVRIVTIVGPGGIGKSRLAIEVGSAVAATGREVAFVPLESLSEPQQVVSAIARAVGVRDSGGERLGDKLIAALIDRDLLLVVDNMEHLLDATGDLVDLVSTLPRLQVLVTSRSPLRVRAERTFELGPLAVPSADRADDADAATGPNATPSDGSAPTAPEGRVWPAVALFVQFATGISPGFRLTPENTPAVEAIVRAVDGVPLAIELAAARVRTMSPEMILARLDSAFTLLVGGSRDLPPRQQALRSTIDWSVRLLEPAASTAFDALSVFTGPFSLEAAMDVIVGVDDIDAVEALLDASLLWQRDRDGLRVFGMLSLMRAFARERIGDEARAAATEAWVAHYMQLAREATAGLRSAHQLEWMRRLDAEAENLTGVVRHLLNARRLDEVAEFLWSLYLYVWISGLLGLVRTWMTELLEIATRDDIALPPRTEAIALYFTRANTFWREREVDVIPGLRTSAERFREVGDPAGAALAGVSLALAYLAAPSGPDMGAARSVLEESLAGFGAAHDSWGEAMTLVTQGRIDIAGGDVAGAAERFARSLDLATANGELLGIAIAQHHRGWPRFFGGDIAGAEADFAESLDMSIALRHDEGVVYGLEGLTAIHAARGDADGVGLLIGAAQRLRRRTGTVNPAGFELYAPAVAALRESGATNAIDAAIAVGAGLTYAEVLARVAA